MHYCGIVPARGLLQLVMLEEVREEEPPIRLAAVFYEPGTTAQIASELTDLEEVVVAIGAPTTTGERACDELLRATGVQPARPHTEALRLAVELAPMGIFHASGESTDGGVPEGAYRAGRVFETNADAVFCALQGHRLPAKRHPQGVRLRIDELIDSRVIDDGGDLWQRRIEEIDATGVALCAHRYAVGHASWLGDPEDAVLVLPGSSIPPEFTTRGVLTPVERLHLPRVN